MKRESTERKSLLEKLNDRMNEKEEELNARAQQESIEKTKKKGFQQVPKVTLKDLTKIFSTALDTSNNIKRCMVSITNIKKIVGKECYRVEQIFTDINNVPVYVNEDQTAVYANVVLANKLDNDLKELLGDKESVTFEL